MKRKSTQPGGSTTSHSNRMTTPNRQPQKNSGWFSNARARRMNGELGKLTARRMGRELAYADRVREDELCWDLAAKFAHESGDVPDRYEEITSELLAARYTQTDGKPYSLSTVLR